MHRLLTRQVQKTLGRLDGHSPEVTRLLEAVDAAYAQADEDRLMLERSMELSSHELIERNGALTAAEEKYRSIFEGATEGIFQLAPDGRMLVANPALARIIGFRSAEKLVQAATAEVVRTLLPHELLARLEAGDSSEPIELELRHLDGSPLFVSVSIRALRRPDGSVARFDGILRDVTARRQAEAEREELNRKLVDASRRAGMAEVATGVLHNVGNVLNSVNVSVSLLSRRVGQLKLPGLVKAARMLRDHPAEDRGRFVTQDEKGQKLPEFFVRVADQLVLDQADVQKELATLEQHLEHVKGVIAMQQSYARASGVTEQVTISELIADALKLEGASLDRHGTEVVRALEPLPSVLVDKHRLLQILVNLITNAKQAMEGTSVGLRVLTVRSGLVPEDSGRFFIEVEDTGMGIPPENLTKIFSHGFTTKTDGHGFGLHASANSAKAMRGALTATSEGPGRGARFRLELPVRPASEATADLPRSAEVLPRAA